MHPYVGQALAAEQVRDWQRQAALVRRAKKARRARRGTTEVLAGRWPGRGQAVEMERLPQGRPGELGGAVLDQRDPVGAGRA